MKGDSARDAELCVLRGKYKCWFLPRCLWSGAGSGAGVSGVRCQWCGFSECLWWWFWTEALRLGGIVGKIQNKQPWEVVGRFCLQKQLPVRLFTQTSLSQRANYFLIFLPFSSNLPEATDLALQRGACVSCLCPKTYFLSLFHDKIFFQVSRKELQGLRLQHDAAWRSDAAQGTAAQGFGSGGKRISIPCFRAGIAKLRVVLLEPEGNGPGAAFWWKRLVTRATWSESLCCGHRGAGGKG